MNIHISRDGVEIGVFTQENVVQYISDGSLLPSDYAWHENLSEWVPLLTLFPPQKPEPSWKGDFPTERQIEYIQSFGVELSVGMTKGQASDLIEQLKNDPEAKRRKEQIQEAKEKERRFYESYYTKVDLISQKEELSKMVSRPAKIKESISDLKAQIKAFKKQLAELPNIIEDHEEQLEVLQEETKEIPDEIKGLKEDIKESEKSRIEFWLYTIKFDSMGMYDQLSYDLHDKFGHVFKVPSKIIISDLLQELDVENFEWDKQDMTAFYKRLEQKHPELKKKS